MYQWKAIKNVAFPQYWGIETTDPIALVAGDETIIAPESLSESAAKTIVEAHNAVVAAQIELLSNPIAVHINMVRGVIAKPSWENLRHLYPHIYDLEHEARRACALSLAVRLTDIIMMLDAPDAYARPYIAAVCRATLSTLPPAQSGGGK